ncbi:hypothetical protein [Rhizobium sp. LjRoot254]|uniref:hypothetical protein n=1 Tax=Rhizobium sp. LjRoot254 TaxID=3342297 RepID=UPI003ECCD689
MVARAGTLLIPSGPENDPGRRHLHVVCTDPDGDGNQLIVSITTWTNNLCDAACIIQPHEHAWLRHQSYVFYRKARIEAAATLDNGLRQGIFEQLADMNAQTFLRIRNGVCSSQQTPRKIKRYFGC